VRKLTDLAKMLRFYVITDLTSGGGLSLVEQAKVALEGGATTIQLRCKDATSKELYEYALAFRRLADEYEALFIVNDRLDVALAANADGVHLGTEDLPIKVARKIAPEGFIIGATARTPQRAVEAQEAGANYLGVGAMFPTRTKKDTVIIGIEGLKKIKASVSIPCVAIGGITLKDVKEVMEAGACGVAVSSAIFRAESPKKRAKFFKKELEKYEWKVSC